MMEASGSELQERLREWRRRNGYDPDKSVLDEFLADATPKMRDGLLRLAEKRGIRWEDGRWVGSEERRQRMYVIKGGEATDEDSVR